MSTALYARTFSATTRHIIKPGTEGQRTLCGHGVALAEHYTGDDGQPKQAAAWMIRDLPPCERCERSAAKHGITPGDGEAPAAAAAEPEAPVHTRLPDREDRTGCTVAVCSCGWEAATNRPQHLGRTFRSHKAAAARAAGARR